MRNLVIMECLLEILLLIAGFHLINGAKILAFFPAESPSHNTLKSALLRGLATRGHEVTVVSALPEKTPTPNLKEIVVESELFKKFGAGNAFEYEAQNIFQVAIQTWTVSGELCKEYLNDKRVQNIIQSKDLEFDLIILEAFFSECFLPFGYIFKAPIVKFCTFGGTHWMGDWVGNPNPYSYVPDGLLDYTDRMNFWERSFNALSGTFFGVGRQIYFLPRQDSIVRPFFKDFQDMPHLSELDGSSTSLLLLNSHISLSYPQPLMPNTVQVGGLHIKEPKKLPQDIQKYLDDAPHGVIYFSMGSILKSSKFPDDKRQALLEAFSKLKQNILWKWENETLPGQPKNVKLGKWLPQSDILAHPNVRMFLTHGGLLSSQEAISRGVPIVGIPIFSDQKHNVNQAMSFGYGIMLDFKNMTTESVTWALKEVLENPRYREKAQQLSRIHRDQLHTPLEQAVFWIEYVIRYKGAPHMRSAVLDLAWYQHSLLDVISLLVLGTLIVLYTILKISKLLLRILHNYIFGSKVNIAKKKD